MSNVEGEPHIRFPRITWGRVSLVGLTFFGITCTVNTVRTAFPDSPNGATTPIAPTSTPRGIDLIDIRMNGGDDYWDGKNWADEFVKAAQERNKETPTPVPTDVYP